MLCNEELSLPSYIYPSIQQIQQKYGLDPACEGVPLVRAQAVHLSSYNSTPRNIILPEVKLAPSLDQALINKGEYL